MSKFGGFTLNDAPVPLWLIGRAVNDGSGDFEAGHGSTADLRGFQKTPKVSKSAQELLERLKSWIIPGPVTFMRRLAQQQMGSGPGSEESMHLRLGHIAGQWEALSHHTLKILLNACHRRVFNHGAQAEGFERAWTHTVRQKKERQTL